MAKLVIPTIEKLRGKRVLTYVATDVSNPFDRDSSGIAIGLDNFTVVFFEDPEDGYRSSCYAPWFFEGVGHGGKLTWCRANPVNVVLNDPEDPSFEGIRVLDAKYKLPILHVGTGNTDDYYPYFVGTFLPENMAVNRDVPPPAPPPPSPKPDNTPCTRRTHFHLSVRHKK